MAAALLAAGCTCQPPGGPDGGDDGGADAGPGRCEADLSAFLSTRSGQLGARQVQGAGDLIGGPNAQGAPGDFLLENERVKVVIQGPGRHFGPNPYGGTILDADLKHAGPGADQFGEVGLLYNFGRAVNATSFQILNDGADGKAVVLAATGEDTRNDYLSIRNRLGQSLGKVPVADPYVEQPLRITNYFVLNPGEQRVRFVSALCNTSASATLRLAVGDLVDPGYVLEFFNPQSCTGGFGFGGTCFGLDRMTWFGYQGVGVAYALAPWKVNRPEVPEPQNATLSVAGVTGSIVGANGVTGLLLWIDATRTERDGQLTLAPGGSGVYARDFWIARDLGEISNFVETTRAAATGTDLGTVNVTVRTGAVPVEGARVAFQGDNGNAIFFTDAQGHVAAKLTPRTWQISAWAEGRAPTAVQTITLVASTPSTVNLDLAAPHSLSVTVREANGGPMPAKVTLLCNGPCAVRDRSLVPYGDRPKDPVPDNVQTIQYVPASGTLTFAVPAGEYDVVVSRGPEYSVFPNGYPAVPAQHVDLRTADGAVAAVLARVLDTTGWMSADFHVHAVNSPDSIVDNATRALTFAADDVEVLVSTDHDFVTDYAPIIRDTGLSPFLASVVGEEVSPMEFGHYNLFPLARVDTDLIGGALDWAGPDGPTLTVKDIFAAGRRMGARTVHFNHPRGSLGGLTFTLADTDTFATHVDPVALGMAAQPDATAGDTKVLGTDFNAMELLNPGEDGLDGAGNAAHGRFNDWFTVLSRGFLVAGTGVSDTHYRSLGTGWRTWVEVGVDTPAAFSATVLSDRLNAMRAVTSNGPFLSVKAYRVDATGAMVTMPVGIGGTVGPDPRELGVQVEVQVPEYLDVTRVELYLHQPQDDASCPVDPLSPRAPTARVACNGLMNTNWAPSGVTASQAVALTPGDLETAAVEAGVTYRRYRKTVTFRLPAPARDNWLVAMAYGSKSLAPVSYPYPGLSGSVADPKPFAFSNPIIIDADGNGYDHPPFDPVIHKMAPKPAPPKPPLPTDEASVLQRWGEVFSGH